MLKTRYIYLAIIIVVLFVFLIKIFVIRFAGEIENSARDDAIAYHVTDFKIAGEQRFRVWILREQRQLVSIFRRQW